MKKKLTEKQQKILDFLIRYQMINSTSPSLADISNEFNIKVSSVNDHLKAIEKKGYISRSLNKARSIKIIKNDEKPLRYIDIKLFNGKDFSTDKIMLSNLLLDDSKEYFALYMSDDSMKNIGIMKDDLLIFEKKGDANSNEIIFCYLESLDQYLVRRYSKEASRVILTSEADNIPATVCMQINIFGILNMVVRNYAK